MIATLLPLAALALTGLAEPAQAPERITYAGTGNGWTGGRTEWSIDRSGRGFYRTTILPKLSGQFNMGPEGFERVRAILQPLEDVRELPCETGVTDQGQGALSWWRGKAASSLRFDFGCNFRQPDPARERLVQASELIKQWALAKPATGRR